MQRAIIYTRVSTDEQNKGYSPEDQKLKLLKYCQDNQIEVEAIYHDDASAKTFERPEWKKIVSWIKSNPRKVNLLLFIKWDRFSRNAPEAYEAIRLLNSMHVEPKAIEQPLDLRIPENKLMLAIYLAAPEAENDRRALNVLAGMRRAKMEGRWLGRSLRGYRNARDARNKPIMIPSGDKDQALVEEAFSLFATGIYNIEEVRIMLKRKGLQCNRNSFWMLLRNKGYIGYVFVPETPEESSKWVKGMHEPIIDELTFEIVQDILEGRKRKVPNTYMTVKEEYPLRGYLSCPRCGGKITASASKGKSGRKFHYYHCTKGCKERNSAEKVNNQFLKLLESLRPNDAAQEVYLLLLKERFKSEAKNSEHKKKLALTEIEKQNTRLNRLKNLMLDDELSAQEFKEMKSEIVSEIEKLNSVVNNSNEISECEFQDIQECFEHLKKIEKLYSASDLEVKQRMVSVFFTENLIFENDAFRTPKLNSALELIVSNSGLSRVLNKKSGSNFEPLSLMVGDEGFEPPTPCL